MNSSPCQRTGWKVGLRYFIKRAQSIETIYAAASTAVTTALNAVGLTNTATEEAGESRQLVDLLSVMEFPLIFIIIGLTAFLIYITLFPIPFSVPG